MLQHRQHMHLNPALQVVDMQGRRASPAAVVASSSSSVDMEHRSSSSRSDGYLQCNQSVAPPGFCNTGGSEVWVYRGSRVRSPPVLVLSEYQRGSLLDGLAVYLSCDTKKFHDNESIHMLHNFWTSTHGGEASPPWRRHYNHLRGNWVQHTCSLNFCQFKSNCQS